MPPPIAPRPSPTGRPARADARRNHARLLDAARSTFAAQGADVSLDEIARRAGVGIGTLYRHFPTRRNLLAALLHDDLLALSAEADHLLTASSPAVALQTWMRAVIAHAAAYRGLAAELLRPDDDESPLGAECLAMREAGAALLARAQTTGQMRPDIDATDLFTLINGIAWATEQAPGDRATADRLLALVLDGLLTHHPSPTTAPAR